MHESIDRKVLDMFISKNNNVQMKVFGNSMEPTLKDNDIIFIEKQNDYNIGDVIVFFLQNESNTGTSIVEKRFTILLQGG